MWVDLWLDSEMVQSLSDVSRFVVVECFFRKPCWEGEMRLWSVRNCTSEVKR